MITHIVLFRLSDELTGEAKRTHLAALKEAAERLPETIAELEDLRIVLNVNTDEQYDLGLIAHCADLDRLRAYAGHPDHVAMVAKYIKPYLVSRACIDFES